MSKFRIAVRSVLANPVFTSACSRLSILMATVIAFATSTAQAHPGHGETSATHWLTEPDHVLAWGCAILGATAFLVLVGRHRLAQ